MSRDEIEMLVADGTLRRTTPDAEAAARELGMAKQHIETARAIGGSDPAGGLTLAYEAARKAIRAHMRLNGLRVGSGEGGHAKIGTYGLAAFREPYAVECFRMFDRVRQVRNRVQYDAFSVEDADVSFALEQAEAIVAAVEADLG